MKNSRREQVNYYKEKLEFEKNYVDNCEHLACEQRMFVVRCSIFGLDVTKLIEASNRTLEDIAQMKKCVSEIETAIHMMEGLVDDE